MIDDFSTMQNLFKTTTGNPSTNQGVSQPTAIYSVSDIPTIN